jgi:hypothetical protein
MQKNRDYREERFSKGVSMSSNKKNRRNIRRLAERKGLSYRESVEHFYGKDFSRMDKNLLYSLHKNTNARRNLILSRPRAAGYDASNHDRDARTHGPDKGS